MTREEIEELKGLAASMGLYDDKKPCKRAVILGKAIKALKQEPFINKPCVSEKVCEHDKQMVLDKIRAEIMSKDGLEEALEIIDKYKAERSDKE